MSEPPAVVLSGVRYGWQPALPVVAIDELRIGHSERVFISGPSGTGKSTLLGLVGGVLVPQAGTVTILGTDLGALSTSGRDAFRAEHVGFIFQMFNLLPYLSVIDNVALPCRFSAVRWRRAVAGSGGVPAEAARLLGRLGLDDPGLLRRPVTQLSIGQQQRVAAARALIGRPRLVIADEPTSSLDANARASFIDLLLAECRDAGSAVLFVSHDLSLAPHFDRRIALADVNRAQADRRAA
ncbi:MAG: ABC transporter ATP-binding protein [Chromatiales bacterium]|nr:ABC transporter ATP-binding protein [Chromatiales bacterium]